ncbi:MAG: hypothetical protein Q7R90_02845 [bacterium]|nr:hypothetical protein [bacterium]
MKEEQIAPFGEKTKAAAEKVQRVGKLGITGADWAALGGTVPADLKQNPDKTRAELMTDEQIVEYLSKKQGTIAEFSKEEYRHSTFHKNFLVAERGDWNATINYLRSIGRLPKTFDEG